MELIINVKINKNKGLILYKGLYREFFSYESRKTCFER